MDDGFITALATVLDRTGYDTGASHDRMGIMGLKIKLGQYCTNSDPLGPCMAEEGSLKSISAEQKKLNDFVPFNL